MVTVKFRPLRRIKKTGKITVASYMQWRKVKTADYSKFNLIVESDYKRMPPNEYVYDHLGKQLFFFQYHPDDIPVYTHSALFDSDIFNQRPYGIRWDSTKDTTSYNSNGMDCDGVPTFNHLTADKIVNAGYKDMNAFEPLTVETVTKWFGWFLYQLQNCNLKIKD